MGKRLLIADDEDFILDIFKEVFEEMALDIETASSGDEALKKIDENRFDVVLTDLKMPGCDGLTVLRSVKELQPDCEVIMMTGYGTIETAVEAMKLGAFHYITKPFKIDEVRYLVMKALEHSRIRKENINLRRQVRSKYSFENIIGTSSAMMEVLSLVEKVADTDSTILILGESGTGKEMIARAIHYNSSRANNLLVPVNCGAIPEDLLESELFGHVKGAFTGAVAPRAGRFELANHGTIFLDEIAEMSPKLQVRLLRVLQEKEFEPVGSTKTVRVDVRVIAATNKDLEAEVGEGRFREDLYYRLNVIPVRIPPLRERKDDIPLLFSYFIDVYNERKGRHIEGVADDAMEILIRYPWPGNVRELENLVERVVVVKGQGKITVADLPDRMREGETNVVYMSPTVLREDENPFPVNLKDAVDRLEVEMIKKALKMAGGNREMAANLLGIKRTTLVEKIKRKNIEV